MRRGFRNAEPEEPPGGAESERSRHAAEACVTTGSTQTASVERRSIDESETRGVATASIDCVSQSCTGMADSVGADAPSAAESPLP